MLLPFCTLHIVHTASWGRTIITDVCQVPRTTLSTIKMSNIEVLLFHRE